MAGTMKGRASSSFSMSTSPFTILSMFLIPRLPTAMAIRLPGFIRSRRGGDSSRSLFSMSGKGACDWNSLAFATMICFGSMRILLSLCLYVVNPPNSCLICNIVFCASHFLSNTDLILSFICSLITFSL